MAGPRVRNAAFGGLPLEAWATADHRFYEVKTRSWVKAQALKVGAAVVTAAGALLMVTGTTVYAQDVTAYNLTVEGAHTYYAGDTGVLVHNCDTETVYRTMSEEHFTALKNGGGVSATGETFISTRLAFSQGYKGVTVKFTMQPGTMSQLESVGMRHNGATTAAEFGHLPLARSGWARSGVMFKMEGETLNIGLGRGQGLDIFNRSILNWEVIS